MSVNPQLDLGVFKAPSVPKTVTPTKGKVGGGLKSATKSANNLTNTFRKLAIYKKKQQKNIKKWAIKRRGVFKRNQAKLQIQKRKDARAGRTGFKAAAKNIGGGGIKPLQFIGAILTGWIINQLPIIIETGKKFMEKLKPVIEVLKTLIQGIVKTFEWIWEGIKKVWNGIQTGIKTIQGIKEKLQAGFDKVTGVIKKAKDGFDKLIGRSKKGEKDIKQQLGVNEKGEDINQGEELIDPADKEDSAIVDTKKGEVEGKTPPKPKTNRDEVITRQPYTGTNERKLEFERKKTELKNVSQFGGTGRPITVQGPDGIEKTLKPGTPEYAKFFNSGNKTNVGNLNKPKKQNIITVPIPKMQRDEVITGGSGDGGITEDSKKNTLNSKDVMMLGIE